MPNSIIPAFPIASLDSALDAAIKDCDADQAFELCNILVNIQRYSGLTLAKVLWTIQQHWQDFGIEDDFYDNAALRIDMHRDNIERYVRVHEMLTKHAPQEILNQLQDHNIRDLIPIANAVHQGYEIEEATWNKLANADTSQEISSIVREDVKGADPRSNSITIRMDRDGSLWAFRQEQRYFVGSLEVSDEEETIQKAINRIVSNSGIMKQ